MEWVNRSIVLLIHQVIHDLDDLIPHFLWYRVADADYEETACM